MLPTFALGLILGSGEESIRKLITNRNFNKNIRESIRQLYPSQKEQLFKLVRNNLPNKERSLKKCIKNFKTQALNAGFDPQLVKELSKKGTFKTLVAAENALGGRGIFYGATPFQKFMKHRHDAKGVRATPNVESNKELETSLTPIYSKANNLGRILGISGTKTRAKSPTTTVSPDNRQTRVAAINLAPTPIAAKEEILTFETNLDKNLIALPEKTEAAIKEFIHSTKNTVKTFEFEFSESAAKMSVEISKGKARLHVLKSSAIIKDLTKEVNSVHETASHSEINSNGLKIKITKK